jgi:uncharacterized protein (DUF1330 family)
MYSNKTNTMMSAYYIISYDIRDMETFKKYPPLALPLIQKYGGEVVANDLNALAVEGIIKQMHALVKFPSVEKALACYNDPAYQEVAKLRLNTTFNCSLVLAKGIA